MPKTEPWSDNNQSTPIWDLLPEKLANRAREVFAERAAIMEYDGGQSRGTAEITAYAFLVEKLWDLGVIDLEMIDKSNVNVQLKRAVMLRRHAAIGRRIMAGTWNKVDGQKPTLSPEEII
jgi:hypothetical protein